MASLKKQLKKLKAKLAEINASFEIRNKEQKKALKAIVAAEKEIASLEQGLEGLESSPKSKKPKPSAADTASISTPKKKPGTAAKVKAAAETVEGEGEKTKKAGRPKKEAAAKATPEAPAKKKGGRPPKEKPAVDAQALTNIKGIGAGMADKFKAKGINSIAEAMAAEDHVLAEIFADGGRRYGSWTPASFRALAGGDAAPAVKVAAKAAPKAAEEASTKKAGRPKKEATAKAAPEAPAKKKGGRPPKEKPATDAQALTTIKGIGAGMADKFKAKGINSIAEAMAAEDHVLAEIFADGGRRYGSWTPASFRALAGGDAAPAVKVAAKAAPKAAEEASTKKAGRPKKEAAAKAAPEAPAKKKGGRPPKEKPATDAQALTTIKGIGVGMADKFKAKGINSIAEAMAAKDSVLAEIFADSGRRYGSWTPASFRALAGGDAAPAVKAAPKAAKAAPKTTVEAAPKKAGRPKKEAAAKAAPEAPAKKKGGRPPKEKPATDAQALTTIKGIGAGMADKFKAKGINSIAEAVAAKDHVLAEIFADSGRRYGSWTPASFRALAGGDAAPAVKVAPKAAKAAPKEAPTKKAGRPKKMAPSSTEAKASAPVKKQGRPRKETATTIATATRKAGRPKTASTVASILPEAATAPVEKLKLATSTPLRHIKAMGPAITKNLVAEGINSAEGIVAASDETLMAILQNSGAVYRVMTPKALRKRAQEAMDQR